MPPRVAITKRTSADTNAVRRTPRCRRLSAAAVPHPASVRRPTVVEHRMVDPIARNQASPFRTHGAGKFQIRHTGVGVVIRYSLPQENLLIEPSGVRCAAPYPPLPAYGVQRSGCLRYSRLSDPGRSFRNNSLPLLETGAHCLRDGLHRRCVR